MRSHRPHGAAIAAALALVLAAGIAPASSLAAPSASTVAEKRAALERSVDDYAAARERVDAVNARVAKSSARLDTLVAEQQAAQNRLDSHAAAAYRAGRLSFLTVLAKAADFSDFSSRWFLITRINQRDAAALVRLKLAKKRALSSARSLLRVQAEASRELRTLADATSRARSEFADSRAEYAEYLSRTSAIDASPSRPSSPSPAEKPAPTPTRTGSGAWQTAKASHYGRDFTGRGASGRRIGPDSMIVAHKTLPFGTLVEFKYKGRTCVAEVADRGPYVNGRTWDLGPGVIRILDFNGVHNVQYRIIGR